MSLKNNFLVMSVVGYAVICCIIHKVSGDISIVDDILIIPAMGITLYFGWQQISLQIKSINTQINDLKEQDKRYAEDRALNLVHNYRDFINFDDINKKLSIEIRLISNDIKQCSIKTIENKIPILECLISILKELDSVIRTNNLNWWHYKNIISGYTSSSLVWFICIYEFEYENPVRMKVPLWLLSNSFDRNNEYFEIREGLKKYKNCAEKLGLMNYEKTWLK